MRKIKEVFRQRFELNRSYREIANSLNIGITTVGDYMARAKAAGVTWPELNTLSEQELYDGHIHSGIMSIRSSDVKG